MSLARGKDLASKDEKILELETEICEKLQKLNSIDKDWKDAKNRLTKDSTVKRLSRENEQFKSMKKDIFYGMIFVGKLLWGFFSKWCVKEVFGKKNCVKKNPNFVQNNCFDIFYKTVLGELAAKDRAFDAFKEHSADLIERERYLNKRLRNYSLYQNESNPENQET